MAYFSRHPFGVPGEEFRLASLKAFLANMIRDVKAHPTPYEAKDFLPGEEQTPDDHLSIIEQMNMAYGGKDLRSE